MTDYTATESGTLIWVESVTGEFAAGHPTNSMNEVAAVEVFKSVSIWIVGIGTTIEIMSRRVFDPILVTGVLLQDQNTCNNEDKQTYSVFLLVVHERSNSAAGIGTVTSLTTNTDGSTTNTEMVDSAGDGMRRGRHLVVVM